MDYRKEDYSPDSIFKRNVKENIMKQREKEYVKQSIIFKNVENSRNES